MRTDIHTSKHRPDQMQYSRTKTINLPACSNSSAELVKYALHVLKQIFIPGLIYAKAGVIVTGITSADQVTVDLFDTEDHFRLNEVSEIMDGLNRKYGRNTIVYASQKTAYKWQTRANQESPCFTTEWNALSKIQLD